MLDVKMFVFPLYFFFASLMVSLSVFSCIYFLSICLFVPGKANVGVFSYPPGTLSPRAGFYGVVFYEWRRR